MLQLFFVNKNFRYAFVNKKTRIINLIQSMRVIQRQ